MIPSADPKADYLAHAAEIDAAIERVLKSGHYILGPEVAAFEREFSQYQGEGGTIGVANGTDALELALRACDIGPGDRVVTVANTVTATVAAIEQVGATAVLTEVDPDTLVMSPAALAESLARSSGGVRAVIPVHLYGQPANMPEIVALSRRHGARVIEDCAQAHGAEVAGRRVGNWGDLGAFSFYPTKNLGAMGDGGAVTTLDKDLEERVRLLRQYGWRSRYVAERPGRNSRLDEMQAAILRVKLRHLDVANERRRGLAKRYLDGLRELPLRLPVEPEGTRSVFHQFVVRTSRRDELRASLLDQAVDCAVLYPTPIHHQPAYPHPGVRLPVTEAACREVLCLPCHPGVTDADAGTVIAAVRGFFGSRNPA